MLEEHDIDFIREARKEIRSNRERLVTIKLREVVGHHPVTDEPIYEYIDEEVMAVVTVVTTQGHGSTGNDNTTLDTLMIVTGDIVVDISIDDVLFDPDEVEYDEIVYEEVVYKVKSFGLMGMAEYGRLELLGGRVY